MSWERIVGGTVQVGLKTTWSIFDVKIGRLAVGLADLDPRFPDRLLILQKADLEARDVDEDDALGRELVQDPAASLEIDPDLQDARLDGNVQLGERPGPDGAVAPRRCRVWKARTAAASGLVVRRRVDRLPREIAGRREAAPQGRDPLVGHADLQGGSRRDRVPAAPGREGPVVGERGAGLRVPPEVRPHGLDRLREPSAGQRLRDELDGVLLDDAAGARSSSAGRGSAGPPCRRRGDGGAGRRRPSRGDRRFGARLRVGLAGRRSESRVSVAR